MRVALLAGWYYLSGAALARAALLQGMGEENVTVSHPQGGSSVLPAGDSPIITKVVVGKLMIVFVEVVSSDGAITEQRQEELLKLVAASPRGYGHEDAVFVTAYRDRQAPPVARAMRQLAWRSFAWFMSEPDHIVQFHGADTVPKKVASLVT